MTATVAVVGGSGKTGRALRAALDRLGVASFATGRAEWAELSSALSVADRVYVVAPNLHPDEPAYVHHVVGAARVAGVQRLVYHSVAAPYAPDLPHHLGKAVSEDLVRRSGLAWTVLQPGAYLQNLPLDGRPVRVAYSARARFGFAHLPDVAGAAARVLLDDRHVGATYELASFTASPADVAAAVGTEAVEVAVADWEAAEGAALGARERSWLVAMFDYYDRHGLPVGNLAMRALLGREPTGLRDACAAGGGRLDRP